MPKFDVSEYEYSEYEKYLSARSNTKGLILDRSNSEVSFKDSDRTVVIYVDPYFAYEFERENDVESESSLDNEIINIKDDGDVSDIDQEDGESIQLKKLCKKFNISFYDVVEYEEEQPEEYDHDFYPNALSGSVITYHLGEGLLDFFYFDIKKHISSLKVLYALMSNEAQNIIYDILERDKSEIDKPQKVKNEMEKGRYIDQRWEVTNEICKEFFYSSLYTAIFTPVVLDVTQRTYIHYVNYILTLQKEFQEKLTFCFDPDFYPSILGKLSPVERYAIYCNVYKDFPIKYVRQEEFKLRRGRIRDRKIFFEEDAQHILNRFTMEIDTDSDEYKEFTDKYCKHSSLDYWLRIPSCVEVKYKCSSIFDMLNLEFTKMLESDIKLRKCKRCGKYFIMKGNYDTNYCDRIDEGQTRSCQELAAQEKYKAKVAENPALPIYSKYYKRYAARVRSRQLKEKDFKQWKYQAMSMRDKCSDGELTPEEYIEWMESCFPNRKPKK